MLLRLLQSFSSCWLVFLALLVTTLVINPASMWALPAADAPLGFESTEDELVRVDRFGVLDLTYQYPTAPIVNPWEQVVVAATFSAPSGTLLNIDGFYYDVDTYKVRFTPIEVGIYTYSVTVSGPSGSTMARGSFESVNSALRGFIRRASGSANRLQYGDGTAFFGSGFNDCWDHDSRLGGLYGAIGDAKVEPVEESGTVDIDTYFSRYGDGDAQFNLFRWNPGNCSFGLYRSIGSRGNTYLVSEGQWADDLLSAAHMHGFQIMLTFFYNAPFRNTDEGEEMAALKRYVNYVMARYGAYVSVWEITNETLDDSRYPGSYTTDRWLAELVTYVRANDPYSHLITNSNPRPNDAMYLDVQSPHAYGNWGDLFDLGKKDPVLPQMPGEIGLGNEQPICAVSSDFMRVQLWTAIMGEVAPIWWNGAYPGSFPNCRNMYLGSKERRYNRILRSIVDGLQGEVESKKLSANSATAYGLVAPNGVVAYVTSHAGDTTRKTTSISVEVPFSAGRASWIDPATGRTVTTFVAGEAGDQAFTSPVYTVDVVLVITRP